ncbi:hypothetical protein [Palaeococcus ferrophilus]|uniref:hypothetical protein n=1 Tax=Palaeococcus ferrophilus TaxID=83868 RepID=UPI00064EDE25|nr:hypothetical protein [Palaeococcus ferrophilus]
MIGVAAVIISSLVLGQPVLLLGIFPFILSMRSRDAGLGAYFLYAPYVASKVPPLNLYSYLDGISILIFALSLLLLLEDVLRSTIKIKKTELAAGAIMLLSPLFPEAFIVGALLYLASLRPEPLVMLAPAMVTVVMLIARDTLQNLGGSGGVLVLGGFTALTAILLALKNVKSSEMLIPGGD